MTLSPIRTSLRSSATLALLLLAPLVASNASAQSTRVIIELPNIAILNYTPQVTVTIPAAAFGAFLDQNNECVGFAQGRHCAGANSSGTAAFSAPNFTWSPTPAVTATNPTFVTSLAAVPLLLEDVWAIRGIWGTAGANVTAALVAGGGTLSGPGGSVITVSAPTTVGGAAIAAPGFVAANAVFGDVQLTLDLTAATRAGSHSHATLDTYTLSVAFL